MGWDTSNKTGFDFKRTTQQTTEAMAKTNKVFDFGTKPLRYQPALTAITHKELYMFGAESSPSQSTPAAPKQEVRPTESLPTRLPAALPRTALRGLRHTDTNGRSSKRRRRHHGRRVTLGDTRVRENKHSRWWFSQRRGRDRTLNKKQTAISAAKGAAKIALKTQRMIPAQRRKKRRQEPWLLTMGI